MKNKFSAIFWLFALLVSFSSCTKEDKDNDKELNTEVRQHNDDINNVKSEQDNVNSDIYRLLSEIDGFNKTGAFNNTDICGATIDTSQANAAIPTLIITFNGTTICPNPQRIKSGQIKIELIAGNKWTDAGAKLKVSHTNYKIQFPQLNNAFLTFNGTKFLTNVEGINWLTLFLGTSRAKIKERSNDIQVTFENGQTSLWKSARLSEWGINNTTEIYAVVNGDTTINGKTIDSWGLTRFGTNFTTEMIEPWKSGTACGWWNATEGIYKSETDNFTVTATFNVDENGNQVNNACGYGVKLDWSVTNPATNGSVVLQYLQ
jgi:hypothetical protein